LASKVNSEKLSFNIFQAILADDDEDSFEKEAKGSEKNEIKYNQDDVGKKELQEDKEQAGIIA